MNPNRRMSQFALGYQMALGDLITAAERDGYQAVLTWLADNTLDPTDRERARALATTTTRSTP